MDKWVGLCRFKPARVSNMTPLLATLTSPRLPSELPPQGARWTLRGRPVSRPPTSSPHLGMGIQWISPGGIQ